jgi:CBS domain-containing protein
MNVAKVRGRALGEVKVVAPDATLAAAAQSLADYDIGLLVVCDGGGCSGGDLGGVIAGVISERDIVHAVGDYGADALDRPVSDFMTRDVETCGVSEDIDRVMTMMARGGFRHMPIVQDGRLNGMVSASDIMRYLQVHATDQDRALFWSKVIWI